MSATTSRQQSRRGRRSAAFFFDTEEYAQREEVINESVYLSPSALGSFALVTHVPLVLEGLEDYVYYAACERLRNHLETDDREPSQYDERAIAPSSTTLLGVSGRLLLTHQWQEALTRSSTTTEGVPSREYWEKASEIASKIDGILKNLVDT